MKKFILIPMLLLLIAASVGCANGKWNENPLRSLTEKQEQWFDESGEHFRFR